MVKKQKCLLVLLVFLSGLGILTGGAQAQQPVVYAVLFYSSSCTHCHEVTNEILPQMHREFGEQLQMLYIDASQPEGKRFSDALCNSPDIHGVRCGYVPTVVIGTNALISSTYIAEQMPDLVRAGLEAGGIDLPPIPGLRERYGGMFAGQQVEDSASSAVSTTYREPTWQDRLKQDKLGNSIAIGVLAVLLIGLGMQASHSARLLATNKYRHWEIDRPAWMFVLGLAFMTAIIAWTVALKSGGLSVPAILAATVTLGMLLVVWIIGQGDRQPGQEAYIIPAWVLPGVACLGLLVAGYLAYVEMGENEAVCGAVGDCNTVQQSEYARLFGLIPIGALGVLGYILILATWGLSRYTNDSRSDVADALLLGLALFGTLFSVYLTFLEPFVIGATCAWCLTSAMLMVLILSLHSSTGWTAVNCLIDTPSLKPYQTRT